jgi:Aldose 1-epimerase
MADHFRRAATPNLIQAVRFAYAGSLRTRMEAGGSGHQARNLAGQGKGDVLGHVLTVNADNFTPIDKPLIPTGEIRPVKGTPMGFTRAPRNPARASIRMTSKLKLGGGYDHNYVLNKRGNELSRRARPRADLRPGDGSVVHGTRHAALLGQFPRRQARAYPRRRASTAPALRLPGQSISQPVYLKPRGFLLRPNTSQTEAERIDVQNAARTFGQQLVITEVTTEGSKQFAVTIRDQGMGQVPAMMHRTPQRRPGTDRHRRPSRSADSITSCAAARFARKGGEGDALR